MKITRVFTTYEAAIQYSRDMSMQGYDCRIYEAYKVSEQRTLYTVHATKGE